MKCCPIAPFVKSARRPCPGAPSADHPVRSTGGVVATSGSGDTDAHRQVVRDAAKHETDVGIRLGTIHVFENQPVGTHLRGPLQVRESRVELGDEQGIVARQRGNEFRIDCKVPLHAVAGRAGAAVAVEGFTEEDVSSDTDVERDDSGDDARVVLANLRVLSQRERRGGTRNAEDQCGQKQDRKL